MLVARGGDDGEMRAERVERREDGVAVATGRASPGQRSVWTSAGGRASWTVRAVVAFIAGSPVYKTRWWRIIC
jgi:hypothetical protein